MKAEAKIALTYMGEREAKSICDGVSPDNLKKPRELSIETWISGESFITYIKYNGDNLATLLSTIDDLLNCVATAERTILAVKRNI